MTPDVRDERRHRPTAERWWGETWCFEFQCFEFQSPEFQSPEFQRAAPGTAGVGGYVALTLLPNQRRAWYWAALVGPGRPLVTLSDLDVPWAARTLEIRSDGLWADHVCEEPLRRWTIGNEAFAVALDDPEVALGDGRGTRTPFGIDLEWEGSADPHMRGAGDGYEIAAAVHGEVLVGTERLAITGSGRWWHRWGDRSWVLDGTAGMDDRTVHEGLRAPVRLEIDDDVLALEMTLSSAGWQTAIRPPSPPGDDDRTRTPPATG